MLTIKNWKLKFYNNSIYKHIIKHEKLKLPWGLITYLLKWLKLIWLIIPSAVKDAKQLELSYFGYTILHSHQHFGKYISDFLFNIYLSYNPVISFLGIYLKKITTYVHKRTCI